MTLLVPWTIEEYPGYRKFMASLCDVKVATSDQWLYGARNLPRKHARRFAEVCRQRAEAFAALAEEFEALADRPKDARERRQGFRKGPRGG